MGDAGNEGVNLGGTEGTTVALFPRDIHRAHAGAPEARCRMMRAAANGKAKSGMPLCNLAALLGAVSYHVRVCDKKAGFRGPPYSLDQPGVTPMAGIAYHRRQALLRFAVLKRIGVIRYGILSPDPAIEPSQSLRPAE